MSRADSLTIRDKIPEYYSDFLTNLETNPVTGLIARVNNEESVKQSIRNLILTRNTERFYFPTLGSKVHNILFDPIDKVTEIQLQSTIRNCIEMHEPRAHLLEVNVVGDERRNAYFVEIVYSIINIPDKTFTANIILKRIR